MSTIDQIIDERGITEVLHFTTNRGLTGILASRTVLSRDRLPSEKYVEHVFRPNAKFRKDTRWLDYVNLSITKINAEFLGTSERWALNAAEDVWWCVLAFDPAIMTHDGVYFATSNNIYTGTCHGTGAAGLQGLFEPRVRQYLDRYAVRTADHLPSLPTCRQAEVLYPVAVSTEFLRTIYAIRDEHADVAAAIADTVGHAAVPVEVSRNVFV